MYPGKSAVQIMAIDDSEWKWAEAEQERFVAELKRKSAERERFKYSASYYLNCPLVTVSGFLSLFRCRHNRRRLISE